MNEQKARNAEIRRRRLAGESNVALGREYGLTRARIAEIVGPVGWRTIPPDWPDPGPMTGPDVLERRLARGVSQRKIAALSGMPTWQIDNLETLDPSTKVGRDAGRRYLYALDRATEQK